MKNDALPKERKYKLLFVTNELGAGGVERLTVDFANRLQADRFDITLATLWNRPRNAFHGSQIHPDVRTENFHFKRFWDFVAWFRLYRYIRKERFDIVFTQLFMSDLFGRTAAFVARTPLIVTAIQNLIPNFPKKYIIADRVLAHITDACISPTHSISVYAHDMIWYPGRKIHELPTNSVDIRRFEKSLDREKLRRDLGVPAGASMILTVGRLIEQKGHTYLLKAVPAVLAERPDTYFFFAGIGGLREGLEREVRDLDIGGRVQFLGVRSDVPDLMRSADLFVFPSVWEGQGMVLAEAMFADLPIIASNVGGIPDVIEHEATGLLCEPKDVGGLAGTILRALDDKALRQRLAATARGRYGHKTIDESAKKMSDLLISLLRKKRPRQYV